MWRRANDTCRRVERSRGEHKCRKPGEMQDRIEVGLYECPYGGVLNPYGDGNLSLLVDLQVSANVARRDDDLLQQRHLVLRFLIDPVGMHLREALQRDGLCARTLRKPVPELFGKEGHNGVEQPQGSLEDGEYVAPGR